jgi:hypothetical protein
MMKQKWIDPKKELPCTDEWVVVTDGCAHVDIGAVDEEGDWFFPTHEYDNGPMREEEIRAWRNIPTDPHWSRPK